MLARRNPPARTGPPPRRTHTHAAGLIPLSYQYAPPGPSAYNASTSSVLRAGRAIRDHDSRRRAHREPRTDNHTNTYPLTSATSRQGMRRVPTTAVTYPPVSNVTRRGAPDEGVRGRAVDVGGDVCRGVAASARGRRQRRRRRAAADPLQELDGIAHGDAEHHRGTTGDGDGDEREGRHEHRKAERTGRRRLPPSRRRVPGEIRGARLQRRPEPDRRGEHGRERGPKSTFERASDCKRRRRGEHRAERSARGAKRPREEREDERDERRRRESFQRAGRWTPRAMIIICATRNAR